MASRCASLLCPADAASACTDAAACCCCCAWTAGAKAPAGPRSTAASAAGAAAASANGRANEALTAAAAAAIADPCPPAAVPNREPTDEAAPLPSRGGPWRCCPDAAPFPSEPPSMAVFCCSPAGVSRRLGRAESAGAASSAATGAPPCAASGAAAGSVAICSASAAAAAAVAAGTAPPAATPVPGCWGTAAVHDDTGAAPSMLLPVVRGLTVRGCSRGLAAVGADASAASRLPPAVGAASGLITRGLSVGFGLASSTAATSCCTGCACCCCPGAAASPAAAGSACCCAPRACCCCSSRACFQGRWRSSRAAATASGCCAAWMAASTSPLRRLTTGEERPTALWMSTCQRQGRSAVAGLAGGACSWRLAGGVERMDGSHMPRHTCASRMPIGTQRLMARRHRLPSLRS